MASYDDFAADAVGELAAVVLNNRHKFDCKKSKI